MLVKQPGFEHYKPLLIEGNDGRIDIGFMIDSRLPFDIEYRSHKNMIWQDPYSIEPKSRKIFSRDLPVVFVRDKKGRLIFMFFLTHFKSQRPKPNDPRSEKLRTAQVEAAVALMSAYKARYPGVPMLITGGRSSTGEELYRRRTQSR